MILFTFHNGFVCKEIRRTRRESFSVKCWIRERLDYLQLDFWMQILIVWDAMRLWMKDITTQTIRGASHTCIAIYYEKSCCGASVSENPPTPVKKVTLINPLSQVVFFHPFPLRGNLILKGGLYQPPFLISLINNRLT